MPATAPYQPITPNGSPDFPQANLSTRPEWDDFDRPEFAPEPQAPQRPPTMYPGAADMYAREQQVMNGGAGGMGAPSGGDPAQEFYQRLMEAQEFIAMHREAQAPLPQAPNVPTPPRMMDFAEWADQKYPEFAGRYVTPELARTIRAQYESEMEMAQQMYANDMDRFGAEIEAAKFLMGGGGRGGRGGDGNPLADAMEMMKLQKDFMPEQPEAPGSIDAWLAGNLNEGKTPQEVGGMRRNIMGMEGGEEDDGLMTGMAKGRTADHLWWQMTLSAMGYNSPQDIPAEKRQQVLTSLMKDFQQWKTRPDKFDALALAGKMMGGGLEFTDEEIEQQFGPGTAPLIRKRLMEQLQGGSGQLPQGPTPATESLPQGFPGMQAPPAMPAMQSGAPNPFPDPEVDLAPVAEFLEAVRGGEINLDEAMEAIVTAVADGTIDRNTGRAAMAELRKIRPPTGQQP